MPRDMKTRRALGQGSRVFTQADGRKAAFVTVGYRDGKQLKQLVYGKSEREVVQKQNKIAAKASSVVLPALEVLDLTAWLERFADERGRDRSDSTREKYRDYIRHANKKLAGVTPARVDAVKLRALFVAMSDRGLSPSTRQHTYDFVKAALGDAVNLELIERNPMLKVPRPKGGTLRASGVWSPDECRALLAASEGYSAGLLIRVCLTLGLRIGEGMALNWSDLKGDSLEVKRTLNRVRSGARFRPCKSGSEGVLILDADTLAVLEKQRAQQQVMRSKALEAGLWEESDLIFTSEVGTPYQPRNVARALDAMCKRAGVTRHSSHALRKTYTSLAALHLPPKEIQRRLRHKDIRMTMSIYTFVMSHRERAGALSLEKLLAPYDTLEGGQA